MGVGAWLGGKDDHQDPNWIQDPHDLHSTPVGYVCGAREAGAAAAHALLSHPLSTSNCSSSGGGGNGGSSSSSGSDPAVVEALPSLTRASLREACWSLGSCGGAVGHRGSAGSRAQSPGRAGTGAGPCSEACVQASGDDVQGLSLEARPMHSPRSTTMARHDGDKPRRDDGLAATGCDDSATAGSGATSSPRGQGEGEGSGGGEGEQLLDDWLVAAGMGRGGDKLDNWLSALMRCFVVA